jgi:predicted HicB family RNase H-like nuclease
MPRKLRGKPLKNMIELDGHKAVVSLDPEIGMLQGEFLGLNGGADFYAKTVDDLVKEGHRSLKVFLALCKEKDIKPFREFSGRFNIRLDPRMHETAVIAAAAENKSLNEWIACAIKTAAEYPHHLEF